MLSVVTNPVLVAGVTLVLSVVKSYDLVWDPSCQQSNIQEDLSWSSKQSFKCAFIYKPSAVSFISQEKKKKRKKKKKKQSSCILVWKYPALTIVMFNSNSPALPVCCLPANTQPLQLLCGFFRVYSVWSGCINCCDYLLSTCLRSVQSVSYTFV